ncbi:MAG TPA: crosslink repair DNA glycosylase YcaQ family protein [Acidimicrobiales bacterium]
MTGAAVPEVTRAQVLAHRLATNRFDRTVTDPDDLAIVDLGVQDSPAGSAVLALAARLPVDPDGAPVAVPDGWLLVWSVRGAPHVHRRRDLAALARALWPADDADAAARLAASARTLADGGLAPVAGLRATAEALAAVLTEPLAKGAASAALTAAAPAACSAWCRGCQVVHVSEQLMRLAALPAGARIEPGTSPPVLARIPRWAGPPAGHEGGRALVAAYLRLHGPAAAADVAAYLQASRAAVTADWPAGLAEVRVDGRRAWLPADLLDDLVAAPDPGELDVVRLLPRSDPWLTARDRTLTVPDPAHRRALWPTLGQPGAVLAGGEVVGTWRTRAAGRRLDVAVRPFGPRLPAGVARAVEAEAAVVAATRGAADVRVAVEGG